MKQKYYFIIAILSVLLILGCTQKTKAELPSIKVVYSVYGGFIGFRETLTINNDGLVVLEEEIGKNKTVKSIQLSNEEIQEFKKLVNNANVFELEERYDCGTDCPTDAPFTSVKFIINGKEKIISMYVPKKVPENLQLILEKIQTIEQNLRGEEK